MNEWKSVDESPNVGDMIVVMHLYTFPDNQTGTWYNVMQWEVGTAFPKSVKKWIRFTTPEN